MKGSPFEPSRSLVKRIASLLRPIGGVVRWIGGSAGRSMRRLREGQRLRRRQRARRRTSDSDGSALALDAAGEGCGCLAEAALDGLFALLVIAGLGWLASHITGGGA